MIGAISTAGERNEEGGGDYPWIQWRVAIHEEEKHLDGLLMSSFVTGFDRDFYSLLS